MRGIEEVLKYWKNSKIIVLFEKGDKTLPNNYRPICITPILYRLFNKILLSRIHKKLDEAQSKDQAGFRAEFGCINYIFTLTAITKRANKFGKLRWIATVDFEKVFDSVEYKAIWTALLEQGIEPAYVIRFKDYTMDRKQ